MSDNCRAFFLEILHKKNGLGRRFHHDLLHTIWLSPSIEERNLLCHDPVLSSWLEKTELNGWLVVEPPLWKMMDFVSWDDDIPNMMGKIKAMFQTTNQMVMFIGFEALFTSSIYIYRKS